MVQRLLRTFAIALACCAPDLSDTSSSDPSATLALLASSPNGAPVVMRRPPSVPGHFVATPNGWFDPDCVVAVAADERVVAGAVVRPDGAIRRRARPCASPRFDAQGRVVVDDSRAPAANGWVESLSSRSLGPLSFMQTSWNVPAAPTSNSGQTIYFFPGLENSTNVVSILQPVLGWNALDGPRGWSLSSWNCCVDGTTWHSDFLPVSAGTTVSGELQGAGCNLVTGVCPSWSIVSRNSSNASVTLNTSSSEPLDWLFAHVLEAYSIDTCSELPASPLSVASGFVFRDVTGAPRAAPIWAANGWGGTPPSCGYALSQTMSSVTLAWSNGNTMTFTASPPGLSLTAPSGNVYALATVTITNTGASTVGPLKTSIARVTGTMADGSAGIGANACAGSMLVTGASCQLVVEFASACSNVNRLATWALNVSGLGANNTVVVPVSGKTIGGPCQ